MTAPAGKWSQTQADGAISQLVNQVTAFAYISTPAATTIAKADTYYFLESTFTNTIASNISAGTSGIQIDLDCRLEIEFEVHGVASVAGEIVTAIVKNPTFVSGELTAGTVLEGSQGAYESDTVAATNGFGSSHSMWAGDLEDGDEIALVIKCADIANSFLPHAGAATLHQVI